ncbi:hypothetical protein NOR53_2497 [gamma proteobacterium NOR5-3]|nr:hypothetical protein NOR53_2497 [gamma proteobacterium NOR5-3]
MHLAHQTVLPAPFQSGGPMLSGPIPYVEDHGHIDFTKL